MRMVRSFWYGVAAGCALVIVTLLGRAARTVPTLPELVQDRLVLLMPGPMFSFLLDRFLYLGKPLLFGSLLFAQVLLGGLAGVVIGRWGRPALVALAGWLLTGVIVLPLAERGVFADSVAVAVVTFLAFGAYTAVFLGFAGRTPADAGWLVGPWRSAGAEETAISSSGIDRRRLLAGGLVAAGTVVLARRAIGRLPSLPPRGSLAAAASGGTLAGFDSPLPGLPPLITPSDRFYIVSKNLLDPELDADAWRLQVDGLVAHPLNLRYDDLLSMPAVTEIRTLECISNEVGGDLISNGRWTGVRLAELLRRAGVQPGAAALYFTSADRYTATMSLDQALAPETLLVYHLNDQPLPQKHGYPLRVLGAGTFGMKNPKWLTRIEVIGDAREGFWQQQGWDERAIVQTMAQITTPADDARLATGATTIGGVAFAGARGITRVEVSTDGGGGWNDAHLLPSLGPNTWTFWQYAWQASQAGAHALTVRATDGTGAVQTARRTDPFPAGATGYHQVRVRVTG